MENLARELKVVFYSSGLFDQRLGFVSSRPNAVNLKGFLKRKGPEVSPRPF
jgi:hypothetical protein